MGFYKKIISNKNRSIMEIGKTVFKRINSLVRSSIKEIVEDSLLNSTNYTIWLLVHGRIDQSVRESLNFETWR